MRIVHAIAGPYPAFRGSQVLVAQLVAGLRDRGHAVDVVSYGSWLAERPGFHPGRVPLDLALIAKLWRAVRAKPVDVVHAHNYEAGAAASIVGRLTGVPFVFHGHSAMADEMPLYARGAHGKRILSRVGGALDRTVPRLAAACLAVTEELAGALRRSGARRVRWLPPVLRPSDDGAATPADESSTPTVAYAGNLDAYQNLDALWRAFAVVRRRVPAARLIVVSHPDARRAAARLVRPGLPPAVEIVYASSYEEVRARLAEAHVLVAPRSESTGYPMKLLNYMAVGKAIVATAGGAKGLRDGETARVVRDHDPHEFAAAIGDLLENPSERRRLGAAVRAVAGDPQRFIASLAALERVYDEVTQT
jgi:glycosyltransferase involved in cell wall biosynthesis